MKDTELNELKTSIDTVEERVKLEGTMISILLVIVIIELGFLIFRG